MKKYLLPFISLLLIQVATAQQTKLLTAEKHNEYGLVYSLPVTAFEIEVTAVKEIRKAGPFYNYAKKFAGNSKAIAEDSEKWIVENVKVRPYGIADDEKQYLMQLKPGAITNICVSEDGMLLSINKEVKMPVVERTAIVAIEGNPTTGKEYLEYVNEDFLSAQSSYIQARLLAEELQEIRDAKLSLTRGTAETMPTDGRQLELMLESLDRQEKALMQAFSGNSWKERATHTFTYVPKDDNKQVLFRLSDRNGFVGADDYSGNPVYAEVSVVQTPEIPVDAKGEEKKLPKDAVIYCIPGNAELKITGMGKTFFSKAYPMSQFGMTFGLNPTIFTDKREPSFAVFDPTTGALLELGSIKQ